MKKCRSCNKGMSGISLFCSAECGAIEHLINCDNPKQSVRRWLKEAGFIVKIIEIIREEDE